MRLLRLLAASLMCFALFAGAGRADATAGAAPPSPLRLIPAEADLLLQIKDPCRLAELVRKLDLLQQVQAFTLVKEQLDSTQARCARQLLAHVEKTLGKKWPDLLDRLAGGGAAVGVKFAAGNAPFVLVVQGKDEKLTQKFLELAVAVAEDELARQESKDVIVKGDYHGVPGYKIGKDFLVTRLGAALVLSNHKDALAKAIDLHLGKETRSLAVHPRVAEADKLLPEAPLVNLWVNLAPLQASPQGKDLYKTPRDNFALTVLFGHYLDVFGRAPFACAGLCAKKDGFLLTFRAPRGRDGMGIDRDLHLPAPEQDGGLPLLAPKGVLYSSRFYLDVSRIWTDRAKLFPEMQAEGLASFDKSSGRFLGGVKLSGLLTAAGSRHRLVVVKQAKSGYQKVTKQPVPAFAFITETRDKKFGRYVDTLLRVGGLAATTQFNLALTEETHNGCEIVGYRFDEKAELKGDDADIRFNFSPCYVQVGNQFVFCSTIELGRELVDLLVAEKKNPGKSKGGASDCFYAAGFAELLASAKDQLITQTILDQAVPPAEAKEQVQAIIKLVQNLGTLTSSANFGAKEFHYDIRLRTGK